MMLRGKVDTGKRWEREATQEQKRREYDVGGSGEGKEKAWTEKKEERNPERETKMTIRNK